LFYRSGGMKCEQTVRSPLAFRRAIAPSLSLPARSALTMEILVVWPGEPPMKLRLDDRIADIHDFREVMTEKLRAHLKGRVEIGGPATLKLCLIEKARAELLGEEDATETTDDCTNPVKDIKFKATDAILVVLRGGALLQVWELAGILQRFSSDISPDLSGSYLTRLDRPACK
jgi:hypothetical protein